MSKTFNVCIIGIGSNIHPQEHIKKALQLLSLDVRVTGVSSLVDTKPLGITDQADFVNGAAKVETSMEMDRFSRYLKRLEDSLGRDRSQPKYGPRTIDLDIIIWNGKIVDQDYYSRDFLRNAAAELGFTPEDIR